ncbi:MAG TPA: M61 family peptidase [Candidatus Binatia bacterium]|jgi:predicted metalloprotease with PDZ domain|nr:M61 family peptidase [Candidatus Binatia bacterium]
MRIFLFLRASRFSAAGCALLACAQGLAQNAPIKLDVDATEAPRKVLHARLHFPAQPGQLTLLYPKWIPGEHGPTGPITDLVGLTVTAAGKKLAWERDAEDMYAFHITVPSGASAADVALDFLLPPNSGEFSSGASATSKLLDLSWNEILLYPKGAVARELRYAATLRLPEGWKFGTALPLASQSAAPLEFAPVPLETLIDSPVIAGSFFRTVELAPGATGPPHALDIVADSAAALEIKPEDVRHFSHLVAETGALFGARHYRSYHFLLTLSDHVAHFGLEHHESSDNREPEKYLTDEDTRKLGAFLLPHEMVHSWNGKYRRPAGLATPDFQRPMKGELLWVFEGLTDYLGALLSARSGLWTNQSFREYLALEAAALDHAAGRVWRPLADTTIAAQLLYFARPEGAAWRRSVDFYPEGDLIWLEADTLIRQQTKGRRSLDDFCKKFHGGAGGPPEVVSYTLDDVVSALNDVAPYDWRQFFQARVYAANPHAPLGGIEAAGWRLTYTNQVPEMLKALESKDKFTDVSFSIGLKIKEDGYIIDVIPGSVADKAGVGAAMKLLAVNGRRWTPEILRAAIKAAKTDAAAIELLVENEDYFKTVQLSYHEGEKYSQLERDAGKPDLLSAILKPLTPEPKR